MVGVQQGPSFVEQAGPFGAKDAVLVLGGGVQPVQLDGQGVPQRRGDVLGDLHLPVVLFDPVLDPGDGHGLAGAGGASGVASGADEVRVDDAVPVPGVGEDQPGPAGAAVDGALEVVVVGLGLLPGDLVGGQDVLHPIPHLRGHQRFVQPVVAGSLVVDLALVVRVRQHLLHRRQSRCLRRAFRGGHGGQAPVHQLSHDMRAALNQRRDLIEQHAAALADTAIAVREP